MNLNIKNFKEIFPINLNYNKKNDGILISDRIQNDANLRSLMLASILNKKRRHNLYLISDVSNKKNIPVYNNLKIKNFSISLKYKNLRYFFIFLKSFYEFIMFYIKILFIKNKFSWLIKNFKSKKINIGDLVYDLYIRYDLKFIKPSIYDPKFIKILFSAILKTLFLDFIIKKYKIKILISTQISYSSYGKIILRYGTKNKLKTLLTGHNFLKKLNNYNDSLNSPFSVNQNHIKKNTKKIDPKRLKKFYNQRAVGKIQGTYVPLYTIKKVYGLKENKKILDFVKKIYQIKKNYKINILACHSFSDSPHLCGDMIFNDYYDQFLQTINFIRKNQKEFWIIKPHPARSLYNEDGVIENIIDRYKDELRNVIICPNEINNTTIFNLSDNLINGVSTISIEYASYGRKSILAGNAPFFHKNLFFRPKNKKEYFNLISKISKLDTNLNNSNILLAKRILYILEKETLNDLKVSKILPDLFKNKINDKNYLKEVFKKINKGKNYSILNDSLYNSLDEKILKFGL